MGELARVEGRYDEAEEHYTEGLLIRRKLEDERGIAITLINLGYIALHRKDSLTSKTLISESLKIFQKHNGNAESLIVWNSLGWLSVRMES